MPFRNINNEPKAPIEQRRGKPTSSKNEDLADEETHNLNRAEWTENDGQSDGR